MKIEDKTFDAEETMRKLKKERARRRRSIKENMDGHDYTVKFKLWLARGKQKQQERELAKKMDAQNKPNRKITDFT